MSVYLSNKENQYEFRLFQKICVVFLLFFVFNTPKIIDGITNQKLPDEILFWLLPTLLLFVDNLSHYKQSRVPMFGRFLLIIVWFIINESELFRPQIIPKLDYAIELSKFFSIYSILLFIGTDIKKVEFILKASSITLIIMLTYFYMIYLGVISSNIVVFTENDRYNIKSFHPNAMSFIAVFGIFCIICLRFLGQIKSTLLISFIFCFYLGIILLNASRGAFIMAVILILIYLFNTLNTKTFLFTLIIFFILTATFFVLGVFELNLLNEVVVVRRLINNEGNGREEQAIASWNNFINSPFFGVGFSKAAISNQFNTVRSNVHYTQILASCGLIFSLLYFTTVFFMFWGKNKNVINCMSVFIAFICLLTENWNILFPLSFVAYINYALSTYSLKKVI